MMNYKNRLLVYMHTGGRGGGGGKLPSKFSCGGGGTLRILLTHMEFVNTNEQTEISYCTIFFYCFLFFRWESACQRFLKYIWLSCPQIPPPPPKKKKKKKKKLATLLYTHTLNNLLVI